MKKFQINQYLTLRLEDFKTVIYVANEKFRTCKSLLLDFKLGDAVLKDIDSMDTLIEQYRKDLGAENRTLKPETEFWGHCSNIQAWVENGYDTHLLDMKLAFPLLKELTEAGDLRAKRVFKEEITKRLKENNSNIRKYLIEEGYLNYLTKEELKAIGVNWVDYKGEKIPVIHNKAYLQKRGIKEFSKIKGLFTLESLKVLNLYSNKLSTVPETLGWFDSLKKLRLDDNYLKGVPESIGRLHSLKSLWIQYNNLSTLPESIGKLKLLEVLRLQRNSLTRLPDSLGNLTSLKQLWLRGNYLISLPESLGSLNALEELLLSDNNLNLLPESIGNLHSLVRLDLQRNNLVKLPESIGSLHALKSLSLYNNKLKSLPKSIGTLPSLEHLYLNENKISMLPKSIGSLKSLRKLSISGNDLQELPNTLLNLPNLTHLNIGKNGLEPSAISIIKELEGKGVQINNFEIWDF